MPAASLRRHRNDGTRPRAGRPKPRDGPVGKEYLWLAGLEVQPRDQAPVLRGKRPPPSDGRGTERYGSGKDSYTGEFHKGLKHGQGTMRWSDGREYIGTWTAETTGMYSTEVTLAGVPIQGSPFSSKVFPSYADVQSTASGPGLTVVAAGVAVATMNTATRDKEHFRCRTTLGRRCCGPRHLGLTNGTRT